jgi:hypothetical protein
MKSPLLPIIAEKCDEKELNFAYKLSVDISGSRYQQKVAPKVADPVTTIKDWSACRSR